MLIFTLRDVIGERRALTALQPDVVRRLRPLVTDRTRGADAGAAVAR
jgi:hypothetical protein